MSIKEDSDTVRQKINDIHDSKKGKARISKKNSSFTLRQVISSYENDLEDAKKVNPNLTNIKDFSGDSKSLVKLFHQRIWNFWMLVYQKIIRLKIFPA